MNQNLSLSPDVTAPALARRQLRALLIDLPSDVVDDLLLLTTEAVTNSVRYADLGSTGRIHIALTSSATSVRVEVTDPGTGEIFTPRLSEPDEPGGRGLLLVAELADRWGIDRSNATTVWFELLLAERLQSDVG